MGATTIKNIFANIRQHTLQAADESIITTVKERAALSFDDAVIVPTTALTIYTAGADVEEEIPAMITLAQETFKRRL